MIKLIRCDDRLIHGQCMNMIVQQYDVKEIIVVDTTNATNPILRRIFESAVPASMNVTLVTAEESKAVIDEFLENEVSAIVLMRSPITALTLFHDNTALKKDLNIANVDSKTHKYSITKYAYFDDIELDAVKQLDEMGIHIWFNQIPSKAVIEWADLKKNY